MTHRALTFALLLAVAGCGGSGSGSDGDGDDTTTEPTAFDNELLQLARTDLGLTGDPVPGTGLAQTRPDQDNLVKLGQLLFFSKTLSGGFDVACASCHHPDFAGGDGLSLPVGVIPQEASVVGPGRVLDPNKQDRDPRADGGPNVPRNSQTIFNTAFYNRAMFHDGRVFVLDEAVVSGGEGQNIRTPEGGNVADANAGADLLEAQAKMPLPSNNEMRGFLYTDYVTPVEYREHLIRRLRGEADQACCFSDPDATTAAANWLALFRDAYGDGTASELVTMPNVKRALAAYEASTIFVDTPWRRYLAGDYGALSEEAKRGAMLFYQSEAEGGLGCSGCHSGDRLTDENFHNVGFPQIGRGKRIDGSDPGRWLVSQRDADRHAFRTPGLLNVAETGPYGHAGTFATLEELLEYHADPKGQAGLFDFTLQHLEQFRNSGIVYPYAQNHTEEAIAAASFAGDALPQRALSGTEVRQLVAFLESLSDECVTSPACVDDWTPAAEEDPDGHLLVRGSDAGASDEVDVEQPGEYPSEIALNYPAGLAARDTFADVEGCSDNLASGGGTGTSTFSLRTGDPDFGLDDPHGFSQETWFYGSDWQVLSVMIAGGVSAAHINDDCWPDLVFASGDGDPDRAGVIFYENLLGESFQKLDNMLAADPGGRFTGAAVADLNGDYRRELLFGNLHPGEVPIYSPDGGGQFIKVAGLPMKRHTFGISFALLDDNPYPYFYLSHWSPGLGTTTGSPALWRNDGGSVRPWDVEAKTTSTYIDQLYNFTPSFADFTGDGRADLVIASDFQTSNTLVNRPDGSGGFVFENVTDTEVITDENGMGGALLDRNNDGVLEWFVTSILDSSGEGSGGWGVTGNRLYESTSANDQLSFADITEQTGVRDGNWGWGACAADFDNDGFVDIFHVNGFGYIPEEVDDGHVKAKYENQYKALFMNTPPRLFMNNRDGTFTDEAAAWNIDQPSEGRGVVCFDYDRDGDQDIVLLDHSSGLQFFENDIGHGAGHAFLNIRLVGEAPNTDAIGARVQVTADIGDGNGEQTMLRLSEANSNFNSQDPPNLHFGLGEATTADIRVLWPGGTVTIVDRTRVVSPAGAELVCEDVAVNQFLVLDQRDGVAACPTQ